MHLDREEFEIISHVTHVFIPPTYLNIILGFSSGSFNPLVRFIWEGVDQKTTRLRPC